MSSIVVMLALMQLLGTPSWRQSRQIVPGEALVRFAAGSDGHGAVRRSAQSTPPDLAAVTGVVSSLGERVGIPLRPARVASGEWLLVRVAMDELARRTADRLAQCRAVVRASREPGDSTKAAIRVVLREGSRDARLLTLASRPGGKAQLDSLVGRFARRIGTPFTGAVSGSELVVAVALDSLTVELVERLKHQAGIESAQPNYVVRAFGPRAP